MDAGAKISESALPTRAEDLRVFPLKREGLISPQALGASLGEQCELLTET